MQLCMFHSKACSRNTSDTEPHDDGFVFAQGSKSTFGDQYHLDLT